MIALGVPRFFEKVHARVMGSVDGSSAFRRKLFHWALGVGRAASPYQIEGKPLPAGLKLQHALASALVFKKLHKRLGGRFRFFASGAAPLARHLAEFFYAIGIPICEAYGLTETSPVISINTTTELRFGSVGKVIRNVEVKLAEDGEILVRGPNIMQGYYKEPERTAEVLHDGWLSTGDLGAIDKDGYLSILDRKKDLFKTSGGKYIAPAPIENQLKISPYVSMAVVIAEGRRFPSVLIVPNFDRLKVFAEDHKLPTANMSELVETSEVQGLFLDEINRVCKDMANYERPKKAVILDRELTIEDGEITPSMKVRRRAVELKFARQIEEMYA